MYYSAVVDEDTTELSKALQRMDVDCKMFGVDSVQGQKLLEMANDLHIFELPCIFAGETLVGSGKGAWFDLFMHSLDNPHVHWEAGDSDE